MADVRPFAINQALSSFSALNKRINGLTEAEVLAALNLEAATNRRSSLIDRLISRAVRLNELSYQRQLKERFNGTPQESQKRIGSES